MAMIKREGKGQRREEVKHTRLRVRKYEERVGRSQENGPNHLVKQVGRLKKGNRKRRERVVGFLF